MPTLTPPTGRRQQLPAQRRANLSLSRRRGPSCKWSSSAEGILDPLDAMLALRTAFDADHIETHRVSAPLAPPHEEPGGADDLAPLAAIDGCQGAAKIGA